MLMQKEKVNINNTKTSQRQYHEMFTIIDDNNGAHLNKFVLVSTHIETSDSRGT